MNFNEVDKVVKALDKSYVGEITKSYKIALDEIKSRIAKIYERYGVDGKLDMATMQKMSVLDQKEMTRLNKLFTEIDTDLNALNRGRPQQLSGHLTSVYEENYNGVSAKIGTIADVSDDAFKVINREAVYKSATSELGKIGLQANAQAIKTNIQRSITTSIVQGESIGKMSKRITTDLETNANNAVRIARTETTRVMGEARQSVFEQAQDLGINVQKKWLSAKDDRTRSSHQHLDGEIRDLDKPYSNGLMYPGDKSGPASEVINCRCTEIAYLPDYE
jgi:SPP1 gp7 family putative phage head morphogenesis protein